VGMCRFMSSAVLGTAFAAEAGDTSAPPFKNYSPRSGRDQGEPEGEPHGGSNREAAFTTSIRTHTCWGRWESPICELSPRPSETPRRTLGVRVCDRPTGQREPRACRLTLQNDSHVRPTPHRAPLLGDDTRPTDRGTETGRARARTPCAKYRQVSCKAPVTMEARRPATPTRRTVDTDRGSELAPVRRARAVAVSVHGWSCAPRNR
jgi:hypothetical protein